MQWFGKRGMMWFGCALITKKRLYEGALEHDGRYVYYVDVIIDGSGCQNSVMGLASLETALSLLK